MMDNARCRATTRDRPYYATKPPVKPPVILAFGGEMTLHCTFYLIRQQSPAEANTREREVCWGPPDSVPQTPAALTGRFFSQMNTSLSSGRPQGPTPRIHATPAPTRGSSQAASQKTYPCKDPGREASPPAPLILVGDFGYQS